MKKQNTPIIVFGVVAIALLAYFILTRDEERRYRWHESYAVDSDQPYGTQFISKVLGKRTKSLTINKDKPLRKVISDENTTSGTDYVFIGQSLYLDRQDREKLMKHIQAGNNAFIASLDPPTELIEELHIDLCDRQIAYTGDLNTFALFNFFHDSLKRATPFRYNFRYGSQDRKYLWTRINDEAICGEMVLVPLGYHGEQQINFIRIPFGKGNFFLHCNPIVFSNYFLSKEENLTYLSTVLSYLDGEHILWDEFSKIPYSQNKNATSSPLYYVMDQPSLKYAWYLMLFTIIVYIAFTAKRTQRIIPVLEEKSNSSLAFMELVSTLHFENGDHVDMARKKFRYFHFFVRSRYGIHAQTLTTDLVGILEQRSGVDGSTIIKILDLHDKIENSSTHAQDSSLLIELHQAIDKFYKQCK